MPYLSGAAKIQGDLPREEQFSITGFLAMLDKAIAHVANQHNLPASRVAALQPLSFCAIVESQYVYVVATNVNVGGMAIHYFIDQKDKTFSPEEILSVGYHNFAFQNPFYISYKRHLRNEADSVKEIAALHIAQDYINQVIANQEREARIVKINPIFHGREFMLNENAVFMLGPFSEPYNKIYADHIKPVVESIPNLICERADDIFGNAPIMEDIWHKINEANIIIAGLTGRNPNVFYETGIAHTVGKKVILITQTMEDVPFDLRHLRCIVYDYLPRAIDTFEQNLRNTINALR